MIAGVDFTSHPAIYVLPQPGKAPRRVTNVPDDKAMTGFRRESMEKCRWLVPASAFSEPDGNVKPATHDFHLLLPHVTRTRQAYP
jgi:hypothetical protein